MTYLRYDTIRKKSLTFL